MATDLDKTSVLQALADSTGMIIDRAMTPEKVVGQCWLISKGRVVTLASSVSNYTDAPWALQIKFPHPELNYGVRNVTLHPDFNRREARDYYLAQARGPMPSPMLDNDIATISLDSELLAQAPDRIAELNRALSVPFELTGQDMSGTMRSGDVPQILQSVLGTGRTGLLTMIDSRNIPFARIAVRQTSIVRATFQGLFNEIAMCELLWRQPPGSFAFQPIDYRWPADVPEIGIPTEQMMMEAGRRFEELPHILEMLGGFEGRFVKATPLADFSQIPPNERWLAERIWECMDGFITLNKLPERLGSDTYSSTKMVWDLATMGLLTANQSSVFHGGGQLGPLLVPAQELELNTWDQLNSFFLDPLSGAPIMADGNFFGGAHVLSNKTLLHTTPLPPSTMGAIVLKDGKLIGLHTGPYPLRGAVNPPPITLQRMMWIGAINDLGTKRLRTAEVAAAEAADAAENSLQSESKTSLRMRAITETSAVESMPPVVVEETGPLAKYSKKQILGASGAFMALGLVMMLGSMLMPHGNQAPPPPVAQQPGTKDPTQTPTPPPANILVQTSSGSYHKTPEELAEEAEDAKAAGVAKAMIGLVKAPTGFTIKDSSKLTDPKPSFKLVSEPKNIEMTFIEWPNQSVLINPDNLIVKRTAVYGMWRNDEQHNEFAGQLQHVSWYGNHYSTPEDPKSHVTVTVGVWDAQRDGKAIVFIARPVSKENMSDFQYPANLVEALIAEARSAKSAQKPPEVKNGAAVDGPLGSPEELAAYRKKLEGLIKSQYKPPEYDLDTNTKVNMSIIVGNDGQVKSMAITKANPSEDFNNALQKAIDKSQPWPAGPKTKSGTYGLLVRTHAQDIMVEEQ